jgi:hypothetical protein
MTLYKHRQTGTLLLWLFGVAIAGTFAILIPKTTAGTAVTGIPIVILQVLILCMLLFATLTVEVSPDRIKLWFGPGLIHKQFRISEIRCVEAVRNRWFYGWGIRLTPHGWLFNVSGLDAVEIKMESGRKYRIGTDEPRELLSAIQSVLPSAG